MDLVDAAGGVSPDGISTPLWGQSRWHVSLLAVHVQPEGYMLIHCVVVSIAEWPAQVQLSRVSSFSSSATCCCSPCARQKPHV